jgi:hypothetical protein
MTRSKWFIQDVLSSRILVSLLPIQSTALESSSRQEELRDNQAFNFTSAQMARVNSFATRAATLLGHQMHYQQLDSFNQFPPRMMPSLSTAEIRKHEQCSPDLQGKKNHKSRNVKGTIGGGPLGFALTGRLSGLAGRAMVGNLYSKSRK